MAHFIPLREKTAADLAIIFPWKVLKYHGLASGTKLCVQTQTLCPDAAYASETSRRSECNPARYSLSGQCMSAHMLH